MEAKYFDDRILRVVLGQVGLALDYLHTTGIIHRDLYVSSRHYSERIISQLPHFSLGRIDRVFRSLRLRYFFRTKRSVKVL